MKHCVLFSFSESETIRIACLLAGFSKIACVIFLYSNVGLGKTCFCRGFLKGLGYFGYVRSPSYTLVETYELSFLTVYHFDFYRLRSLEELENIGVRDYFNSSSLCLVEWPNLIGGFLPREDISINLEFYQSFLSRKITFEAHTFLGRSIVKRLFDHGNMSVC